MSEQTPEIPEADAAEQAVTLTDEDEDAVWPEELPDDADEGDAAEQIRVVKLDEDDYR